MPLQHINDTMLRRMSRRVTRAESEEVIRKLRNRLPNLTLRTTFITGFPGETEEQFTELEAFVREQKFERMGAFTYSLEPDTPAALLPDHLAEEVKVERQSRLMAAQNEVSRAWTSAQVGRTLDVILDQAVPNQKNVWVGRSHADAPDVDGLVFVTGQKKQKLATGNIVSVEIVAAQDYDLVGMALDKVR
jgi:ribosomal protein S12 methylthiotransferase